MYELMLVLRPDGEVTDKAARELIQKIAGDAATITDVVLLGKKQLAYPLKKLQEAFFVQAMLTAEGLKTADLEKRIQSMENVVRFLLIQKEG
jgi:small subunit ribosomal protein S6